MHAVLGVDLQALAALGRVVHELIDAGRAVALLGACVLGQVDGHGHRGVLERQVGGLVFGVVGVADEDAGQSVEGQLAIGLGVVDGLALGSRLQVGVVGLVAVQRPGDVALEHELLDAVHQRGRGQALLEPGLEVARLVQLFVQPAVLEGLYIGAQLVALAARDDGVIRGLGGQHAGLDGGMAALDAADVQETCVAAHERAAREHELGQGQQAAGRDGARAVAQALGRLDALGLVAFQVVADVGMGLPALEFLEGAQVGVGIVQARDEAQRDLAVVQVVEEGAAVGLAVHGPAGRMHHEAGLVACRVDFPQLLDAQAVALRVLAGVQLVLGNDLLAQVAAGAFGKDRVLGVQLHAQLELARGLAVLADAHVAGGHALDRAVVVVEHLGGSKAREDFNAQCLGLLAQPLDHVAQANDVVAMVLEAGRQQEVGRAQGGFLTQEDHGVVGDGLGQGRALFLPVRDQLGQRTRVHDRAGQDVGTGLGALFQHDDGDILAFFGRQLLEADGRGQAAGAAANHHHVVFHGFARPVLGQDFFVRHRGVSLGY